MEILTVRGCLRWQFDIRIACSEIHRLRNMPRERKQLRRFLEVPDLERTAIDPLSTVILRSAELGFEDLRASTTAARPDRALNGRNELPTQDRRGTGLGHEPPSTDCRIDTVRCPESFTKQPIWAIGGRRRFGQNCLPQVELTALGVAASPIRGLPSASSQSGPSPCRHRGDRCRSETHP